MREENIKEQGPALANSRSAASSLHRKESRRSPPELPAKGE